MAIRTQHIRVPVSGTAGSAIGSVQTGVVSGRILAVHLLYTGQPGTTNVTVATAHTPVRTILTVNAANTDAWFMPRIALQTTAAVAITYDGTQPIYGEIPVDDHIVISVTNGSAGNIVATILYEA